MATKQTPFPLLKPNHHSIATTKMAGLLGTPSSAAISASRTFSSHSSKSSSFVLPPSSGNFFTFLRISAHNYNEEFNLSRMWSSMGIWSWLVYFAGVSCGRQSYGGMGLLLNKGRPQFRLAISNVATEVPPSLEQVIMSSLVIAFNFKSLASDCTWFNWLTLSWALKGYFNVEFFEFRSRVSSEFWFQIHWNDFQNEG